MQRKLLGTISVEFDVTGQLLIIYSAFIKYLRKKNGTQWGSGSACTDFKKAYDLLKRKVLYNKLLEFGIPMRLVRHKMYLD